MVRIKISKEKLIKFMRKYWFEILILLIIIGCIFSYTYNPEIITFLGVMISLIMIIINSLKAKMIKIEPHKLVFEKVDDILKDIHVFQQLTDKTHYIKQKIIHLQEQYGTELKEVGCDIEKIDDDITINLNLGKEKLIAKPEQRIEIRWKEGHRFIDSYEELDEELKKFKKK